MTTIPRKIFLPVVLGIAFVTLLISLHAYETIYWVLHFYGVLGLKFNWYVEGFCHYYWLGIPFALLIVFYSIYLLRASVRRIDHIVWYAVVAVCLLTVWWVWISLVESHFYLTSFPLL